MDVLLSAIENGANAIAEGFLFSVAAVLIVGESWRSSRSSAKRRDAVDERLEDLSSRVQELSGEVRTLGSRLAEEQDRYALLYFVMGLIIDKHTRSEGLRDVISSLVDAGLKSGWAELRDTPLQQSRIQYIPSNDTDTSTSGK